MALMDVADTMVMFVVLPLPKLTEVTPPRPVPLIATATPTLPLVGEKLVTFGRTVNVPALVSLPPEVVTVIVLLDAVVGTVTLIEVDDRRLNVAVTVPNFTDVTPTKPLPEIVTAVPAGPLVGENPLIVGAIPKFVVLRTIPPGVVTLMRPVVAAAGTVAVI
jgi:hypothetical protein